MDPISTEGAGDKFYSIPATPEPLSRASGSAMALGHKVQELGQVSSLVAKFESKAVTAPETKKERTVAPFPSTVKPARLKLIDKGPREFSERWKALDGFLNLEKVKMLDEGNFNKVFLCRDKVTGQKSAVKSWKDEVLKKKPNTESFANLCKSEVSALKISEHPNLVKVHSIIAKSKSSGEFIVLQSQEDLDRIPAGKKTDYLLNFVVCDYVPGESLVDAMKKKSANCYGPHSANTAIKASLGLAKAISHLHNEGVVHRDVKPDNIMWDGDALKLLDFGLSKSMLEEDVTHTPCGSPLYAAPELFERKDCNHKLDVWALGSVLMELATELTPASCGDSGSNKREVNQFVNRRNTLRFSDMSDEGKQSYFQKHFPALCFDSPGLVDLLVLMFRKKISERISSKEAVDYLEQLQLSSKKRFLTQ